MSSNRPSKRRILWGLLLLLMTVPTAAAVIYFILVENTSPLLQQTAYVSGKAVMALPAVWFFLVERGKLRWVPPQASQIRNGLAFGMIVFGGTLLIYYGLLKPAAVLDFARPAIQEKIAGFGLTTPIRFAAFALIISLAHSALEEYYWRWFVFGRLRGQIPVAWAASLASVAFTGHHVVILGRYFGWLSPGQMIFSLAVFLGGIIWCAMFHRSRSLYGPWISHALIDAAIFVVGYDLVLS
ncbi:MAG: CPBP family intramembrane glutamic endopeptidase [Thermogutta sp.]